MRTQHHFPEFVLDRFWTAIYSKITQKSEVKSHLMNIKQFTNQKYK